MEPCQSCGAALSADAQWCGQCYAVRTPVAAAVGAAAAAPASVVATEPNRFGGPVSAPSSTRMARPSELPQTIVKSRWRKTATTFGPLGRIIATVALVVPFVLFVVISIYTGGLILAAPVIWGFVIMPWGLRDTWKAGQVPST